MMAIFENVRYLMKLHKHFLMIGITLSFLAILTSCPEDDPLPLDQMIFVKPIPGAPAGTWRASGEGDGFARPEDPFAEWYSYYNHDDPGAPITATVTIENGIIKIVNITGPDESTEIGKRLIDLAPPIIIRRNAFNLVQGDFPDSLATATLSRDGINTAGNKAIDKILAGQGTEVK